MLFPCVLNSLLEKYYYFSGMIDKRRCIRFEDSFVRIFISWNSVFPTVSGVVTVERSFAFPCNHKKLCIRFRSSSLLFLLLIVDLTDGQYFLDVSMLKKVHWKNGQLKRLPWQYSRIRKNSRAFFFQHCSSEDHHSGQNNYITISGRSENGNQNTPQKTENADGYQ